MEPLPRPDHEAPAVGRAQLVRPVLARIGRQRAEVRPQVTRVGVADLRERRIRESREVVRAIRADDMGALGRVLSNDPGSADLTLADGTTPLTQAAYLERTAMVARLQAARTSLTFFEACIVGDLTAVRRALDPEL